MTATDTRGNVTQETFEITVVNVNDQPTVARGLRDRCVMAGRAFNLPIAKLGYRGAFADVDLSVDENETLTSRTPPPQRVDCHGQF